MTVGMRHKKYEVFLKTLFCVMAFRICPMSKKTILVIWAYAIRPYVSDLKGFATDFERVGEICHMLGDLSHQNGREMVRKVGFWQISMLNLQRQNDKIEITKKNIRL